ncbi:peptide-methionine (S)-S-oxide reductase MsrA [Pollutibacter soli]|uniref:peptide-methionine (S)-S-oxide reductase MsrA n=1 Tax=Pollutibacter soli TaxID=3034157 RepID=UPI0030135A0A
MIKSVFAGIAVLTAALFSCTQHESPGSTQFTNAKYISNMNTETITLGSGCFWCTEAIFQQMEGVVKVQSGYSGGHVANPTYEQVCEKNTGHVEVVQLTYDPSKVSIDEILEVFWQTHDPTTMDRQGNDVGPQYRSAIFYHNEDQHKKAVHYKEELDKSGAFGKPIVTVIEKFKNFYPAEDYHQNYYKNNPNQPYCYFVIRPKLEKFEKVFKAKAKQ